MSQRKRRSTELGESSKCILCHQECVEDLGTINMDAWNNLRVTAKQWSGLDTFLTVYDEDAWDNEMEWNMSFGPKAQRWDQ